MVQYHRARHGPDLPQPSDVLARKCGRRPNCLAAGNVFVETSCIGECYFEKNNNTGRHLARRRVVEVHGAHALRAPDHFIGYCSIGVRSFIITKEDAARPEDGPRGGLRCYGAHDDRRLLFSFI